MILRHDCAISRDDVRLLASAAAWWANENRKFADLTPACLAEIARTRGMEFATAVFHEAALRVEKNAALLVGIETVDARLMNRPDLIAVVPGAFHREHPDSGADGRRVVAIAQEIGCRAAVIPVPGFGRLENNAKIIANWLGSRRERSIAIVSLSKGGSDLKRALALPNAERTFANVQLWVSFSGIVQGTPLIAWLRARPLRWLGVHLLLWLRRHPRGTLDDLRHDSGANLATWPELPPHLRIVHICGVPLRAHLQHRWAPRAYDRLAALGPNDGGGVLLGALSSVPGLMCPVWGADHYLQPSWNATPLLRDIVIAALTPAARRGQTGHSAEARLAPRQIKSAA
jgi:hypothetical protein